MSDEDQAPDAEPADSEEANLPSIPEALIALKTGIPPKVQQSFWKVVSRIFRAGAEIPAAALEGKAKVIKARYDAEAKDIVSHQTARSLVNKESSKSASALFKREDYANRALEYHAAHIVKEQINRETIVEIAAEEIKSHPPTEDAQTQIDDDWIDIFFKEASARSNADFQLIFGKVLAGEMKKPGTFSVSTIQILSRLDKDIAETFQRFCNCSVMVGGGRVVAPAGNAGENALKVYGLSYDEIAKLIECGLVRPSMDERIDLPKEVYTKKLTFDIAGHIFFLAPLPGVEESTLPNILPMPGPGFTGPGRQLRTVVPMQVNQEYLGMLSDWLHSQNLALYREERREGNTIYGSVVQPVKPNS